MLEKNLADADEYIKREDEMLEAQSRLLFSLGAEDSSDYSGDEYGGQMNQLQLMKQPGSANP